MKKTLFIFFFSISSQTSFCQNLTASIILVQEPYCRTAGHQSGNGVLIASSSGGAGSVSYQWYDSTFTAFGNQTFPSGLIMGPGKYYLQVVDEMGEIALDSIEVDSINPKANFELVSNNFYTTDPYEAYNKAEVKINNLAPQLIIPPPVLDDTLFFWTIENNVNEIARYYTQRADEGIDTIFNSVGVNDICLVEQNFNNCRDTLCKKISIVSSLILDSKTPIAVFPDYNSQTIQFHSKDFTDSHTINIFSLDGKLVQSVNLNSPIQTVNFNHAKGAYVFSVTLHYDLESSGKFVFGL